MGNNLRILQDAMSLSTKFSAADFRGQLELVVGVQLRGGINLHRGRQIRVMGRYIYVLMS